MIIRGLSVIGDDMNADKEVGTRIIGRHVVAAFFSIEVNEPIKIYATTLESVNSLRIQLDINAGSTVRIVNELPSGINTDAWFSLGLPKVETSSRNAPVESVLRPTRELLLYDSLRFLDLYTLGHWDQVDADVLAMLRSAEQSYPLDPVACELACQEIAGIEFEELGSRIRTRLQ
jgi:hypothetical protein